MDKRKVLIISYIWPPMEGVGLIRALKFAKYLPRFGWEPVILTVRSADGMGDAALSSGTVKVFRTDYVDIISKAKERMGRLKFWNKPGEKDSRAQTDGNEKDRMRSSAIKSVLREFIAIPDEQIGWYEFAAAVGKKIVNDEGIDIIFSTSPPETAHLIARELKRGCSIPWVADLRDLWADDHYRARPLWKKIVLRAMEKRVFKDADKVVTVSKSWAEMLRKNVPGDKLSVVENGFDDEDFTGIRQEKNEKLTINYMGKLHKVHQPVDIFFRALAGLIRDGVIDKDKIEVKFYVLGHDRPDITAIARDHGLSGIVTEPDSVNYDRSLEVQRASDILLFVQWTGRGNEGWYSAKLYDYLGARRTILALAKKGGIIENLIKVTSSGVVAENEEEMRRYISAFYNEYLKNGSVRYFGREEEVLKHTRLARTADLARVFDLLFKERR